MAFHLPLRLLSLIDGQFKVIDPSADGVREFDIITYTWGDPVPSYECDIPGVDWKLTIAPRKLKDIKRLMVTAEIQYLWADCVCLNQSDEKEKNAEVLKMYKYVRFYRTLEVSFSACSNYIPVADFLLQYKSASRCYILSEMDVVYNPQVVVDNLWFLGHILSSIGGAALASEVKDLSENLIQKLQRWADIKWLFRIDPNIVRSAGIDMGVINCYSTCVHQVRSLLGNLYFTRVWTFQEMLLGQNITMYGIDEHHVSCLGQFDSWMDLATETKDKAIALRDWIAQSRRLNTSSIGSYSSTALQDTLELRKLKYVPHHALPSHWVEIHSRPNQCVYRRQNILTLPPCRPSTQYLQF
jgi:hypothetical protein